MPQTSYFDHGATFSPDRRYRYDLWRTWSPFGGQVTFVCLNPSTANEDTDDPTIRRCIGFARSWGYGGMHMRNLFALVSTDPRALEAADAIGPENNAYLRKIGDHRVVAWGNEGVRVGRSRQVQEILGYARCFGLTKIGEPRHPLYLPKNAPLSSWPVT